MSYGDWKKVFKQLKAKPTMKAKYIKQNAPKTRSTGWNRNKCRRCGRVRAHISKYKLHLCRHCFREIAQRIGFKKYS